MNQLSTLTRADLTDGLGRLALTIDRALREPARAEAITALVHGAPELRAGLPVLARLALVADCLRIGHLAIEADGQVETEEVRRIADLLAVAIPVFRASVPAYAAYAPGVPAPDEQARFLRQHRADRGPFGYGATEPWPGLALVRRVEQITRNSGPLRDLERMLSRVMEAVFAGRASDVERATRRQLRELFEPPPSSVLDPRAVAFCRSDGPEVFASVAHGSQVHERDPFDVEAIHGEARDTLHRLVERATTPENHRAGHGRTLLLLGESGAGKTHLLRAIREQIHRHRLGYVGYLQMTAEVGDYTRYALRNLIDSLERPYHPPGAAESGLVYLSRGLVEGHVAIPADLLDRLRTAELSGDELDACVGQIIDVILRADGMGELESDLLHALLLLQRRDPALQRRVIKYLRCEPLTAHDRRLLGGLAAREQPEDPLRTIRQLARVMFELQMAALVLVVDQLEETIPDGVTTTRLQQAFDALRGIADAVPSAVVVISCLDDVYAAVRPRLSRSLVDRLERDPVPVRLAAQREPQEIADMLARRLEHLYAAFDAPWREDDPLYPFTPAQVDALSKLRARDVLARFRDYHAACIAAGALVPTAEAATPTPVAAPPPTPPPTTANAAPATFAFTAPVAPPPPEPAGRADVERAWNERLAATLALPEEDDDILALVEGALRGVGEELGVTLAPRRERLAGAPRLVLEVPGRARRVIGIANQRPQGGGLRRELDALASLAGAGVMPIALRSSDFNFGPRTQISQQIGAFVAAGGRTVVLEERELRAIAVMGQVADARLDGWDAWRRTRQPMGTLAFVRAMLDLDAAPLVAVPPDAPPAPAPTPRPAAPPATVAPPAAPPRRDSAPIPTVQPDRVRLGVSTSLRAEPRDLPLEQVTKHLAFLGSTGSGKTTAALNVIEQLLERGVSVLLLDRKGDLARYASEAWWRDPAAPDHARRAELRQQLEIALYTPGNAQGRPLRLPLIPSMADASEQERGQLADFAADGLAAMMGYGSTGTATSKRAVLVSAIRLNAAEREVTLDVLLDTINRPDPELLRTVASLQRFFAPLSEELQSLKINRGALLTGDGEALDVGALLPPIGARPRLTIINTVALTDVTMLQFWVSRLLVELARLARKRPAASLQGVAFFDEADAYLPAVGTPPTKGPMLELLRRARSGGLGVLLATQNPGDFDYRGRDNIGTWLVGKVAQERAIEKMRNLLGAYPSVSTRLANQPTGHFFVLTAGQAAEVRSDRAMMSTEQVGEAEIVELARGTRHA